MSHTSRLLIAAVLPAVMLAVGCQSSTKTTDETPTMTKQSTVNLRSGVPPQATEVAQGSDSLNYTAKEAGRVYLYSVTQNQILGSLNVAKGQTLIVAPAIGRATLSGNEVPMSGIKPGQQYVVYFLNMEDDTGDSDGGTFRITPSR